MADVLLTIINGLGASFIVLSGYFMGISHLYNYIKMKKKLQPVVSILGFSLGSFFLGGMISFLMLLFSNGQSNITPELASYLSGPIVPIGIIAAMYLGFDIFNPSKKKLVIIVFSIISIIYFIAFFGFYDTNIRLGVVGEWEIVDWGIKSIVMYTTIFFIVCVLVFLSGGFYKLQKRLVKGEDKNKIVKLFWGFTCFAIGAIMDTILSGYLVLIGRVIMSIGLFLMNAGFKIDRTKITGRN